MKLLPFVEKIMLTVLAVGIVLAVLKIDVLILRAALFGCGAVFFLYAYRPAGVRTTENEKGGFPTLLGLFIVPKTLWISSAIAAVGIACYLMNFGNDGYRKMLLIACSLFGIDTLVLVFLLLGGVRQLLTVTPILLRAIPLFLAGIYILLN